MKQSRQKTNRSVYYEGISFFEYQENDVFVMTPDQFFSVSKFDNDVVFVWLDNNVSQRKYTFRREKRKYDFEVQESIEREYMQDFIDRLYEYPVLYFFNEEPERVSAILYSVITHPDLLEKYLKSFV